MLAVPSDLLRTIRDGWVEYEVEGRSKNKISREQEGLCEIFVLEQPRECRVVSLRGLRREAKLYVGM